MTDLINAPKGLPLRIVEIAGGHGVRHRLLSLGIHPGDLIVFSTRGILGGPVVIRQVGSGVTIAVGRGVARKILVEVSGEPT